MMPSRPLHANHQQVLRALQSAKGPMKAYELLDAVRRNGISAPQTVYRALTRLVDEGLVHRLESINAYVACMESDHHHAPAVFTICGNCGQVDEIPEGQLVRRLQEKASRHGFRVETTTIELRGRCACCAAA